MFSLLLVFETNALPRPVLPARPQSGAATRAHNVAITNAFHVSVSSTSSSSSPSTSHFPLRKYHFISFSLLFVVLCRRRVCVCVRARPCSRFVCLCLVEETNIRVQTKAFTIASKTYERRTKRNRLTESRTKAKRSEKEHANSAAAVAAVAAAQYFFCRKIFMASLKTKQIKRFQTSEQE